MEKKVADLSRAEQRANIERIISDCKAISRDYIRKWKPVNPDWETIDGAAYIRLSDLEQVSVEKGSLEQQIHILFAEAIARSTANKINYRIVDVYIEPGITGTHDNRPEFQRLQRDIKQGRRRFVIVKELTRIARETLIWKGFFKLCIDHDCEIVIRGFPFNPNDPSHLVQLDILSAFAEYESRVNSKRLKESVFSAMINSGKFNATHKLFGLDQLVKNGEAKVGFYQPNIDELKAVEWIMRTFLKYESYQRLREECDRLGLKNKDGQPFTCAALRTLLGNPKYIGKWEINAKFKDKRQDRLMPYEQHRVVDLSHGCVIDLELWQSVQRTIKKIAGNKEKNTRLSRIYLLQGLLKYLDGSTFVGSGAWGNGGKEANHRNNYYRNAKNDIRIPADLVEAEARQTVAQVLENSPRLREAIQKRASQLVDAGTLLEAERLKRLQEIELVRGEGRVADRKLDFLLKDASAEEIELYRSEYKATGVRIRERIKTLEAAVTLLDKKKSEVGTDDFKWRDLADNARKIMDLIQEQDPVALKKAYRSLFDGIVVGEMGKDGKRELRFVLKSNSSLDLIPAEKVGFDEKLAGAEGFEPSNGGIKIR